MENIIFYILDTINITIAIILCLRGVPYYKVILFIFICTFAIRISLDMHDYIKKKKKKNRGKYK